MKSKSEEEEVEPARDGDHEEVVSEEDWPRPSEGERLHRGSFRNEILENQKGHAEKEDIAGDGEPALGERKERGFGFRWPGKQGRENHGSFVVPGVLFLGATHWRSLAA